MNQWWSWILSAVGITGLYFVGNKSLLGWIIGFGLQVLWLLYGFYTQQWGFMFSAVAYASVNFRNYLKWNKKPQQPQQVVIDG